MAIESGTYLNYPDPWEAFLSTTRSQFGDTSMISIGERLQFDYDYWHARVTTALVLASKISEQDLRAPVIAKVSKDKSLLELFAKTPYQTSQGIFNVTQVKSNFSEMVDTWHNAWLDNLSIQDITGGVSVIDNAAAEEARAMVGKFTDEELAEIKRKAGFFSDDQYEALLRQQLYMQKLAAAYSKQLGALGSEVTGFIHKRIAENEKLIEQSKPTIVSRGTDVLVDLADKVGLAKASLPGGGFFGNLLKWGVIGTTAAVVGGGFIAISVFKRIFSKGI